MKINLLHCVTLCSVILIHFCWTPAEATQCYDEGTRCFPTWFSTRMDSDPTDGISNDQLGSFSQGDFSTFEQPPECSVDKVRPCITDAITRCSTEIYRAILQEYFNKFSDICDHMQCILLVTKCQESVDQNQCSRNDCYNQELENCLSKTQINTQGQLTEIVKAGKFVCQQQDCFNYIKSIPKGTCSYDNNEMISLDSNQAICNAVPNIVNCVLNVPDVCLSSLGDLISGLGLSFGSLGNVLTMIKDPLVQEFSEVYFYLYFSADDCTSCMNALTSCFTNVQWDNMEQECLNLPSISSCVSNAVLTCQGLFSSSLQPILEGVVNDIFNLARWICGLADSNGSMCYSKSLSCLSMPTTVSSVSGTQMITKLLTYFVSSSSDVCSQKEEIIPCLERVVNTYCTDFQKSDILKEFMAIDHVVNIVCWVLGGNYTLPGLTSLPWFSPLNVQNVYKQIANATFATDPLQNHTLRMNIVLDIPWQEYYTDMGHPETTALKTRLEQGFLKILRNYNGTLKIKIQKFFKGSVGVSFIVLSDGKMTPDVKANVAWNFVQNLKESYRSVIVGNFVYYVKDLTIVLPGNTEQSSEVSIITVKNQCGFYDIFSVCGRYGYCTEVKNSPVCKCMSGYDGQFCKGKSSAKIETTWLIVLLCLSVVSAFPLTLVTVICLRRNDKHASSSTEPTYIVPTAYSPVIIANGENVMDNYAGYSEHSVIDDSIFTPPSYLDNQPLYQEIPKRSKKNGYNSDAIFNAKDMND